MKVNSRGKFEVKYSFSKPLSQNCEVLTPRGDVINPKMGQKVQICISYATVDKLMKSKRYCETVRRIIHLQTLSLKILEVLCQLGEVINPKLP